MSTTAFLPHVYINQHNKGSLLQFVINSDKRKKMNLPHIHTRIDVLKRIQKIIFTLRTVKNIYIDLLPIETFMQKSYTTI